ncbi:MAG: type II secretion system protein J [Vulcanimicrobiota bacterium]
MRRRGLTLVEVIVSLTLIAALVVLVFNLFPGSLLSTARGEQTIQADLIAQSALERKGAGAFSSLVVGQVEDLEEVVRHGVHFRGTIEVVSAPADTQYLKGLRATVRWESRGVEHQVVHESWVSSVKR